MLGGFHLMMSYLGSIGEINSGSGLEDLFTTVYAKHSVPNIMNGHAYARAMRAHSLAQLALGVLILQNELNDSLLIELAQLHQKLMDKKCTIEDIFPDPASTKLKEILLSKSEQLSKQDRTSHLWIEYFSQFEIARLFIHAVRTGNWTLYLDSMRSMIPYFHAAGHLLYAKSVHVHIQKMETLEKIMDVEEFDMFTRRGYFTVRHSDLFFKGVPMDLTIEQKLMRNFKTSGLTRGRGITDSTVAQFVAALPLCVPICERLENYCQVRYEASEQHMELRDSWQARDLRDFKLFSTWFEAHPPFEHREPDMLVSLSTGVVADNTINYDKAWEIGSASMNAMYGKNFADVKLKRKDKVKPLSAMVNNITVHGETLVINPTQCRASE